MLNRVSSVLVVLSIVGCSLTRNKYFYTCPDELVVPNPLLKIRGPSFKYINQTDKRVQDLASKTLATADSAVINVLGSVDPKHTNVFITSAAVQDGNPEVYSLKLVYGSHVRKGLAQCCAIVNTDSEINVDKVSCTKLMQTKTYGESVKTSEVSRH